MNIRNKVESGQMKGAKTRLFGVILIFLGTLDSMLAWRGSYALNDLYIIFIMVGLFLYILGSILRNRIS